MEYNVPNTQGNKTSQDVGYCSGTGVFTNPMDIATTTGGARLPAIGSGPEHSEVLSYSDIHITGVAMNFNGTTFS